MKAIYKALADFQQEVPTIKKNASGYGYKFADLEEITNVIKPVLKKHNLGYTQLLDGTSLKTVLFHTESGESIKSSTDMPQGVQLKGMNDFQVLGSAITYLRRYSLSAILGLVTDEDADAHGEQVARKAPTTPSKPATAMKPSKTQLDTIYNLAVAQGLSDDDIKAKMAKINTFDIAEATIKKLGGE